MDDDIDVQTASKFALEKTMPESCVQIEVYCNGRQLAVIPAKHLIGKKLVIKPVDKYRADVSIK
jgi:hypothetical protein